MKLKNLSIKWNIFVYIAVFIAAVIFVIWLFQVVFLDTFYRNTKIAELKSLSKTISENIDSDTLTTTITDIAGRNNICAKIIDTSGNSEVNVETSPNCVLHHLSTQELLRLYFDAEASGGAVISSFSRNPYKIVNINENGSETMGVLEGGRKEKEENIVYTKIVKNKSGNIQIIMLNTVISPVNATVATLRSQLIYLTVIFLLMAVVFAWLISKRISTPIIQINASAKKLSVGNEPVTFDGGGYKEITELSNTLSYASKEITKVETLRRELIANVSHDLRTPLTMITGYAEVMRDIPGETSPENIQIIIDEANRLAGLVTDLLDISKLQAGVQELNAEDYNLTKAIQKILTRYDKLTGQGGYKINFEATNDVWVSADEMKMSQVIYNLLNNAIHYAGEDKTVIIHQIIGDQTVKIEICDHGEGISEAMLPYVWDRYYKIDKSHKQASTGSGLGLSIVKNILEMHGFSYGVASVEGEGSIFWFEVPLLKNCEK